MNILVTGAAGYIGSILSDYLCETGHNVFGIDNFCSSSPKCAVFLQTKHKNFGFSKIDLLAKNTEELRSLVTNNDISHVVHLAALCNAKESVVMPDKYIEQNTQCTENLLTHLNDTGTKKIIFASTCAVYGVQPNATQVTEESPLAPATPYAKSKLLCEQILKDFSVKNTVDTCVLRFFNVTGASQDGTIGDSKNPSTLLVQNAVRGALGIQQFEADYPDCDTPDGSPIRDFVDVSNIAHAIDLCLKKGSYDDRYRIFNIGNGQGYSVLQVLEMVKKITKKDLAVKQASNPRLYDVPQITADITRAQKLLGYKPNFTLTDSIENLVKWYTIKPNGWQS